MLEEEVCREALDVQQARATNLIRLILHYQGLHHLNREIWQQKSRKTSFDGIY
jgi:hypothetical protein